MLAAGPRVSWPSCRAPHFPLPGAPPACCLVPGPSWPVPCRLSTMLSVFVRPEPARPLPAPLSSRGAHRLCEPARFTGVSAPAPPPHHRSPLSALEKVCFQFSSHRTMGSQKLGLGHRLGGGARNSGPGGPAPSRPAPPGTLCPRRAFSVLTARLAVASVKLQVLPFCFCCSESFHRFLLGP